LIHWQQKITNLIIAPNNTHKHYQALALALRLSLALYAFLFAFKVLYFPFMFFRSLPGLKGSEIFALSGFRVWFSGIKSVLPGF